MIAMLARSSARRVARMSFAAYMATLSPTLAYRLGDASGSSTTTASAGPNGTAVGTTTFGVAGLITNDADTALSVGGSGYVEIAQTAVTGFPCSFVIRAKLTAVPASGVEMILACVGWKSQLEEMWVSYVGAGSGNVFLRVVVQSGSAREYYATPAVGTTTHTIGVVLTNSTTCVMYFDGVAATITNTSGPAVTPTGNIDTAWIGALVYFASNVYSPFSGTLDESYIFARVVSAGEMLAIHNKATGVT